jgi:hypothetical protein
MVRYRMDIFREGKRLGHRPALWRRHDIYASTMARQKLRPRNAIAITRRG